MQQVVHKTTEITHNTTEVSGGRHKKPINNLLESTILMLEKDRMLFILDLTFRLYDSDYNSNIGHVLSYHPP